MDDVDGPSDAPTQLNPVPFLAAVGIFAVAVVLSFLFLRDDEPGRLARPDVINQTGDDELRLAVDEACVVPTRVQVDYAADRLLVEFVVVDDPRCDDPLFDTVVGFEARVTLPLPVGDRSVVAGAGRTRLACTPDGDAYRCGP